MHNRKLDTTVENGIKNGSSIPSMLSLDSKPCGLTVGEWSARWWQWLLSIPKCNNPAFDSTGSNAYINQNYKPVFFLCQTYEGMDVPQRSVTVPAGNSLLFVPMINWISVLHHDGESDEELLEIAKERMDVVANLKCSINQVTIETGLNNFRVLSPFFEVKLPEDNIIGMPSGVSRAISDGYWIFIKPKVKEELTIGTFGTCSAGVTRIGVSYHVRCA